MNKKWIRVCLFTFVIGCIGGGAFAYTNHQKGLEAESLLASLSQTQDEWEVEQFIREQEEQRPKGLEESQIVTGSKYNGITYNNVSVATVEESSTARDNGKDTGLLKKIFDNEINTDSEKVNKIIVEKTQEGRVVIQSGSLNIRAENSIDGAVIGQAYKGDIVEIISQDGAWYQVITADGLEGYASSNYIEVIGK